MHDFLKFHHCDNCDAYMDVQKERKSTFLTAFEHREERTAACLLHNIFIAVVSECLCHLRAQYPLQLPDTCIHGRNLVGDTGDRGRNMLCPPHFFLFRFCI